jgi:hypothetical protein
MHEERTERIDRTLERLPGLPKPKATQSGLVETIDRFFRGQQGDGRG